MLQTKDMGIGRSDGIGCIENNSAMNASSTAVNVNVYLKFQIDQE